MRIRTIMVCTLVLLTSLEGFSREVINMGEYGIRPDTGEDIIPAMARLAADLNMNPRPVELRFEPGRYDFYNTGKDLMAEYSIPYVFVGLDSLYINGNGARFIGHGELAPFAFRGCRHLEVSGFSFDWERPLVSQGTIVGAAPEYVDIEFDREKYPFRQEGDRVVFYGEDWDAYVDEQSYSTLHRLPDGDIIQGTKDMFLSQQNRLFRGRSEIIEGSTVRFYGTVEGMPETGSEIVLYHGRYMGGIILLQECSDVVLKDIDIYHSGGYGALGYFVDNVLVDNFNLRLNRESGRCFSAIADALHFCCCRGVVEVRNCSFEGQGDDALNVHGRYHKLSRIPVEGEAVELCATSSPLDFPHVGDQMWLIDSATVSRVGKAVVSSIFPGDSPSTAKVVFSSMDLADSCGSLFVENASWVPNVKVHDNYFGKSNRARGILLTTPGKVEVCNNRFRSAGTAILIEGDITYWYESGAVRDMSIHDNEFIDCATSAHDYTGWGWGEAVITITPSYCPLDAASPAYHRNIRIYDNKFKAFDLPLLCARSVDGLVFSRNTIEQTFEYRRTLNQKSAISLTGCRNVVIEDNSGTGIFESLGVEEN